MFEEPANDYALLMSFLDRLEEKIERVERAAAGDVSGRELQRKRDEFIERTWLFAAELRRELPATGLTFEQRDRALSRLSALLERLPSYPVPRAVAR